MLRAFGSLLWFRGRRKTSGQTVAEYALIVALVAVLSIGILTAFGDQLRDLYNVMINRIAGKSDKTYNDGSVGNPHKGMGNI